MLDGAQEPVGGEQRRGVVPADVAAGRQRGQRRHRAADAQRRVAAPVHELQQLDGELDVAQAAAAELDLALGLRGRDVLLDPAAHRLHVGDEAGPVAGLPHQRPQRVDVGPAEVGVAGDRAHLEQRLELPGAGPLLVVGAVAGERAHQRRRSLPSGRSAASTCQAASAQIRMRAAATWAALVTAAASPSAGSTGSATKTTSTSLT